MAELSVTTWNKNPSSLSELQTHHKDLHKHDVQNIQLIPLFPNNALNMTSARSLTVPQPLQRM
mgnify:CR=1